MTGFEFSLAALAALLIGVSKAGFGGGTALLATPLMALAVPPHLTLGTLLPLLMLGDFASCWLYRGEWQWRPLVVFLPGCAAGVGLGTMMLGQIDEVLLKQMLGAICLAFCFLQWGRAALEKRAQAVHPCWGSGTGFGVVSGITSTLAHAAGPVFAMYILPMQLPQRVFMATTVLGFTCINLLKLPGYVMVGVISAQSLGVSLRLGLFVLLGALAGEWLNRHCPAHLFKRVIYGLLFFTGLELISGKSLLRALWRFATGSG